MSKAKELMMLDGCTKAEAERFLRNGSIVFCDFEECFDDYMTQWDIDDDERKVYEKMITEKKPAPDWGVVESDGKTYYISYAL